MDETDINFSASNLTFNGEALGIGPRLTQTLDLNGFDITGSGFTLNGINDKTQNLIGSMDTTIVDSNLLVQSLSKDLSVLIELGDTGVFILQKTKGRAIEPIMRVSDETQIDMYAELDMNLKNIINVYTLRTSILHLDDPTTGVGRINGNIQYLVKL